MSPAPEQIVETHASRIASAGGSHKTLQTVLGHKSAAFSLTVYAHLFDADLDALADRFDTPTVRRASQPG